jgi:DNA (cytosine-5)-methyltransferase 1
VKKDGLVIDLFAGGGGASVGIEAALGAPVHVALNHDAVAMAVHGANHPGTAHFTKDIWKAAPRDVTRGMPVDLLWASPDCKHHSNAKGGKPRNKKLRVLACAVTRWAKEVRPRIIYLENVKEFEGWGPLKNGKPDKTRKGKSFRSWIAKLRKYGYAVEWRILDASEFGAPTRRRRLFIVARRDGRPIAWPEPTHGPGRIPVHTAAECIDWSLACPSIFERDAYGLQPLKPKTLWRIAQGIVRFVLRNPKPFILKVNHGKWEPRGEDMGEPLSTVTASQRGHALVAPSIARYNGGTRGHRRGQSPDEPLSTLDTSNRFGIVAPVLQQSGYGERPGQKARSLDIEQPIGTLVDGQKHALVQAFLSKSYGDPDRKGGGGVVIGDELGRPIATVTARDHHSLAAVTLAKFRGTADNQPGAAPVDAPLPAVSAGGGRGGIHVGEVRAFLTAYYGNDGTGGQELTKPTRTLTTKERLGLVTVHGVDYQITDIGFRMLQPHELLRAQFGRFAERYDLSAAKTKADKVRLIGNSVCPEVAEALVSSNHERKLAQAAE